MRSKTDVLTLLYRFEHRLSDNQLSKMQICKHAGDPRLWLSGSAW